MKKKKKKNPQKLISNITKCIKLDLSKADPEPARRARATRFKKNYGFVFVNFDCITRIYFDFSQ